MNSFYLVDFYKKKKGLLEIEECNLNFHKIVQRQFTSFLGGYVTAFNLYHQRKGSLLRQNTERKVIDNRTYLKNAIHYLHYNAVHHEFVILPEEWAHSSYHAYLCDQPTRLAKEKVYRLFGGQLAFLDFHRQVNKEGLSDDLEF